MNTNYRLLPQLILLSFCCFFSLFSSEPPLKRFCSSSSCQSQEQTVITPKALTKMAWQAAYSGDYTAARKLLHQAADNGNQFVCHYLAHGYEKGSLITGVDKEQAEKFKNLANQCPDKNPLSTLKIDRKDCHILENLCARQYAWYRELQKPFRSVFMKHLYPVPGKGWEELISSFVAGDLQELISSFAAGDVEESRFVRGFQELNSESLNKKILAFINQIPRNKSFWKNSKEDKIFVLLGLIRNWAYETGQQKEWVGHYFSMLYSTGAALLSRHEKCAKKTVLPIIEKLPAAYQVDAEKTIAFLSAILERGYFGDKVSDGFLLLLHCALQLHPPLFEKYASKLLEKRLDDLIEKVIAKPQAFNGFERTPLAISKIIDKAFVTVDSKHCVRDAFDCFLKKGSVYHAEYQDRIVSVIPVWLTFNDYGAIIALLKSPVKKIRDTAFEELTHAFAEGKKCSDVQFSLKEFFQHDFSGLMGDQSPLTAYRYFYQQCKTNNAFQAIQFLWLHMAENKDEQTAALLQTMMYDFFNASGDCRALLPFDQLFNELLNTAWQQKTVEPKILCSFLAAASCTSLMGKIDPVLMEKVKMLRLAQEDVPLRERCELLDDLLYVRKKEQKSYDDIVFQVALLSETPFKEFARTVIATLNPQQTCYDYFCNRKKLVMFYKDHKGLPECTYVPSDGELKYFQAISDDSTSAEQSLAIHRLVSSQFREAKLFGDQLFGFIFGVNKYRQNIYRFYACDSTDGYAIWCSPFWFKNNHPFAVDANVVYCADDNDDILVFDIRNGAIINKLHIPAQDRIREIYITVDNMLFVLCEQQLCIINLEDNNRNFIKVPCAEHFFVNDKMFFCSYENKNLLTIDKMGRQQEFMLDIEEPAWNIRRLLNGNQSVLWYSSDYREKIVFIDSCSGNKIGEYSLASELLCNPELSKKGDRLYILTKKELIALDISAMSSERQPKKLWSTAINGDYMPEINTILVSEDNTTVYGFSEDSGRICRFDSKTGVKHDLCTVEKGKLLGMHNGKLYIHC